MSDQWHITENGVRRGPVSDADIRSMIAAGQVHAHTQVWREGMVDWLPVMSVPELCAGHPWLAGNPGGQVVVTNGMAIASMVCGIISVCLIFFACGMVSGLTALPAVVLGHMGLGAISRSEKPMGGRGMAITGLVTGYLGLLAQLAVIGFFAFAALSSSSPTSPSPTAPPAPTVSPSPSGVGP